MKRAIALYGVLLVYAVVFSLSVPAQAAEETVQVLGPWKSHGRVFMISPDKLKFMGAIEGVMYIQGSKGSFDAAGFMCPVAMEIDTESGKTKIDGDFIITVKSGDLVFATLNAAGIIGASAGTFTITGGTGELDGITGSGEVSIRTALGSMAADMENGAHIESLGLAVWPSLKITLPNQ